MHTVRRYGNSWRVNFVGHDSDGAYHDTIVTFSTPLDAYSFCSYLNGGAPLSLSATGHVEYAEQHRLFSKEDLDDA